MSENLCPKCDSSYVEEEDGKKWRLCSTFTYRFDPETEEHLKATRAFLREADNCWHTRQCSWLNAVAIAPCSGFKKRRCLNGKY